MPRGSPTTRQQQAVDSEDAADDQLYETIPISFSLDSFPGLLFASSFMTPPLVMNSSGQQIGSSPSQIADAPFPLDGVGGGGSSAFITQSMGVMDGASAQPGSARSLKAQASSMSGSTFGAAAETMPISLEQLKNTYRNWNKEFQSLLLRLKVHENAMRIAAAAVPVPVVTVPGGGVVPAGAAAAATSLSSAPPPVPQLSSGIFSPDDDKSDDDESDAPDLLESVVVSQGSFQIGSLAAGGVTPARRIGGPTSSKAAEQLMDFMAEFESEIAEGVAAILESRTDSTKPFVHPMFECDHMYKHRGVVYNFFAQDRNILDYFGSVENACKVLSCEIRTLRHLVQVQTVKSTVGLPLVGLVKLQGYSVMAWANNEAFHEENVLAGPAGPPAQPQSTVAGLALAVQHGAGTLPTGIRVMTKHHMRSAIDSLCEESLHIPHDRNHFHVSASHRTVHKHTPVVGQCEMIVVHSEDEDKLYAYNVWKLLPPIDVPRTSTSLQIVSPRSSAGTVEAPATGNVRNRYHFINKKCEQYVMFLPQALSRMHEAAKRGGEDLFVGRLAYSSLDTDGGHAEASRRATIWLMQNQIPLAATELLDLSEGARRDRPLNGAAVKAVMHAHGVNTRFLSAVFKCIVSLIEDRAKEDKKKISSSSDSPAGLRRQSSNNNNNASMFPSVPAGPAGAGPAAKKDPMTTPKKQGSIVGRKSQSKIKLTASNQQKEADVRQISTVENNIALHLIRVEAVARSFRVVLNEHLRAIQEARFLLAAGRSRGRRATGALTTLVPHPPPQPLATDHMAMSAVGHNRSMSLVQSMRTAAQEIAVTSVTTRLAQSLRNLDVVLNRRAAESGLRLDIGSTARSLVQMKFQIESQSSDYLVDLNERFDRENPSLSTEDEEKRKVADLLSHLLSEDKGGALFWDQCLFAEIWLKFGFLGARNDLRFVNKTALLKRVCELCNLRLAQIDLSDPQNIVVSRDAVKMIGPLVKLIAPSARVTELSAGRYSVVHMKKKHPAESLNTFDGQELHILRELKDIERSFRAEEKKKKGMTEAQAKLHVPLLAKLERLYQYRGEERRGDHELTLLQTSHCNLVLFYSELWRMWERFGLDGVLYVTCPSCGILYNSTISRFHKCDVKSQWSRKIATEVLPLGLADAKLPNSSLSASSEMSPFFCARFARLGMTHGCWRPSGSLPDEHLLISLPFSRTIVALELQGGDGKFLSCFQLQYSSDGKSYSTYTQQYRHRDSAKPESISSLMSCSPRREKRPSEVLHEATSNRAEANTMIASDYSAFVRQGYMAANSDDTHIARIDLVEPFKAQFVKIIVGNENKATAALRLELFYESHPSTGGNAGREGQSERVAPHHVVWDGLVDSGDANGNTSTVIIGVATKQVKRMELAERELQMLKALDEMASSIMDVPHLRLSVKPMNVADGSAQNDFVMLIRTSSEYPSIIQRHIALLQSWGPERANDIQVMVYELLRYRLAEIRLLHDKGRAAEARNQMSNYMLELGAALGPLGTKTTLIAPIMVLTRDVLAALSALSSFLDAFFQVARWAAKCRHKLLAYILSVLIDSAAASPNSADRVRVSEMCTELMNDDSIQLAAQLDVVFLTSSTSGHSQTRRKLDDDEDDNNEDGRKLTPNRARRLQHASAAQELLKRFPISPLAGAVFDQMKARAALMEVKGSSTRPPDMTYPDWA